MKRLFALIQSHGAAWDHSKALEDQPEWIAHAEFMDRMVDEGFIALGGPLEGSEDVLLILRASSEQEIEQAAGSGCMEAERPARFEAMLSVAYSPRLSLAWGGALPLDVPRGSRRRLSTL